MIHFKLFLVSILLLPVLALAQVNQTVLVRGENFAPLLAEEPMPDLTSSTRFQGKYFKVVKDTSEEAIRLDEPDPELRLKAATTYFHLNLARRFWVEKMGSEFVKNLPALTIRLEITRNFSDLGHFQNASIAPQFNNALSIPSGEPMDGVEIPAWNPEIWFRPKKVILTRDLPMSGLSPQGNPIRQYIKLLVEPVRSSVISQILRSTLEAIFQPATLTTPYPQTLIKQVGTLALTSLVLKGSRYADPLFIKKYYYLDTAMIPEIIDHEFSHIALSDHLALSLSTPILEGLADYFATAISGRPEIATQIKLYSMSMPKHGRNPNHYHPELEEPYYSNSDFVLSVLWLVKDTFPEVADALIFNASLGLSTSSSDIRHDLIRSLLDSCSIFCQDPERDRLVLRQAFEAKGF